LTSTINAVMATHHPSGPNWRHRPISSPSRTTRATATTPAGTSLPTRWASTTPAATIPACRAAPVHEPRTVLVTVSTAAYGARNAWVPAHGPVTSNAPTAASAALTDCTTTSRSRPGLLSRRSRSRTGFQGFATSTVVPDARAGHARQ
jgi:hypothetical protein